MSPVITPRQPISVLVNGYEIPVNSESWLHQAWWRRWWWHHKATSLTCHPRRREVNLGSWITTAAQWRTQCIFFSFFSSHNRSWLFIYITDLVLVVFSDAAPPPPRPHLPCVSSHPQLSHLSWWRYCGEEVLPASVWPPPCCSFMPSHGPSCTPWRTTSPSCTYSTRVQKPASTQPNADSRADEVVSPSVAIGDISVSQPCCDIANASP